MSESVVRETTILQATRLKKPSVYDIIMYNDDVTSMEFVVMVLMEVFEYNTRSAVDIMLKIHNSDKQVVGTYPKSVAEFKLQCVEKYKTEYGYTNFRVEMKGREGNA